MDTFFDNESLNESLNAQSVEDDVAVKCPWNQYHCIAIAKIGNALIMFKEIVKKKQGPQKREALKKQLFRNKYH